MRGMGMRMPLSVERTRAIVDRCVVAYLEARCRKPDTTGAGKKDSPVSEEKTQNTAHPPAVSVPSPARTTDTANAAKQLSDDPVSNSPPDTPGSTGFPPLTHAATIRDFSDFDLFAYERHDTPPPVRKDLTSGPGLPSGLAAVPDPVVPPGLASSPWKAFPNQPIRKPPPPPLNSLAKRAPSQAVRPNGPPHMMNGERSPRESTPYLRRD
jgi:E3 ubiquitin-protein ligase HECTD2